MERHSAQFISLIQSFLSHKTPLSRQLPHNCMPGFRGNGTTHAQKKQQQISIEIVSQRANETNFLKRYKKNEVF